jgi:hypothetical protein
MTGKSCRARQVVVESLASLVEVTKAAAGQVAVHDPHHRIEDLHNLAAAGPLLTVREDRRRRRRPRVSRRLSVSDAGADVTAVTYK